MARRSATPTPSSPDARGAEYTIDELARAASMTVRNVRAYQDRGVLAPPERRGRSGIYSDVHLGRLRLIGSLLERGYTLGNIAEILESMEQGHDFAQFVGLETAVTSPWSDETPRLFSMPELMTIFGTRLTPSVIKRADQLGVLVRQGTSFRAPSPQIVYAGGELSRAGVPIDAILDVLAAMRANVEGVADQLIQLFVEHVVNRYGERELPPPEEAPELAALIWRLRPLAKAAVQSEVARALERSANRFLGDRLAHLVEHDPKKTLP